MDFNHWLDTNIAFEETLLERIKNKSGALHRHYKTKLKQVNDLKSAKTNH